MTILAAIYLTKAQALALGLTHHGSIFGIPAWVTDAGEDVIGVPKVPLLAAFTLTMDWLMYAALHFLPDDVALETPLKIGHPIEVSP